MGIPTDSDAAKGTSPLASLTPATTPRTACGQPSRRVMDRIIGKDLTAQWTGHESMDFLVIRKIFERCPELQEPLMVPWKKGSSPWTCRLGCFFPRSCCFYQKAARLLWDIVGLLATHIHQICGLKRVLNFDHNMTSMEKGFAIGSKRSCVFF